jgi:CheY-like chemotaxis protein/HPt (histidine-containing phosphotransfer) domain-containing protein
MMILLADDDPVQTLLLTTRLKQKGYKVDTAINAVQAWTVASRRPPDVVILDIQMPNGSGYAVLKQMKSSSQTKSIPVIVLSGSIDSNDKAKLKQLGADEFLDKPVELANLFSVLSRLLQRPVVTPPHTAEPNLALSPALDVAEMLRFVEGDLKLLRELAATFWETCPQMMADVQKALDGKSPKSLERAAHALKGSLSYFGTNLAFQSAVKLEALAREGTLEGAERLFAELEKGLSELKVAFDSFEASLGPAENPPSS